MTWTSTESSLTGISTTTGPTRTVYRSTLDTKPLWDPRPDGPHVCVVSSNAYNYFASLTSKAEKAVLDLLGDLTLADSLRDLYDMDRQSGRQA
jgi:Rrf2 family transcriptional regulator, repressor of oqxAB